MLAAMGSVFGPQWTPIMAVCEILASLTVSRKILDVLTRPQNNGKFVRRETFDLCGVFHGYHHSSTSSKGGDASSMVPAPLLLSLPPSFTDFRTTLTCVVDVRHL